MSSERRPGKVGAAPAASGFPSGRATKGITRAEARKVALSFDGASEGPYFGKPAIFVAEKFLTRVHHKEEAVVLAIGSMEMRDVMLEAEPELFYITDHYRNFPYLLARLSNLTKTTLKDLLAARVKQIEAKKTRAPAKKLAAKKRKRRA